MKKSSILLVLTLLMLTAIPLRSGWAQEEDLAALYGNEEFISIATGSSKPITKAPAVASVITAADIRAMGATDLNQVLETVPGIHVSLSTLNRLDPVYSIRGIHTGFNSQVLFLMNGIPFPFLYTGGHPTLFRLPVAAISRIEVIRGPGSAVYGADAFAGVINIITKDAQDIGGTETGAREGSFDTHDLWLQHGQTLGDWDLAFSMEWQKSGGDDDRRIHRDYQTLLDSLTGTDASLAPGPLQTRYEIIDTHLELKRREWKFRLWNWYLNDGGEGAGAAQALDRRGRQDENLYLADLSYRNDTLVPDWEFTADLHYLYHHTKSRLLLLPPGTAGFADGLIGKPETKDRQTGFDVAAIYAWKNQHRLRFGAGYTRQKSRTRESKNFGPGVTPGVMTEVTDTPYIYMPDSSRRLWYCSVQDEWQFAPDWELTAGVRYDHYSDFGDTVNPRMALVWSTRHNLTTKLLYGRAFRAPSFSEQFAANNPVTLGNPDLDPETIDTFELAFDYQPTLDLQTSLSLFTYRAKDLIEFVDSGNGTKTAENERNQEGYGFEFETKWKASETLSFKGNYAWQHAEDTKTGSRVADAPGQQLYLSADWKFLPNWSLNPQWTWVADRKRAAGDSRGPVDNYSLIDLTLHRDQIFEHIDITLSVRNLFDEGAREPSNGIIPEDYPLEGRSLWAGAREPSNGIIPEDYPLEGRSLWAEVRYRFH
ncbi:MAG: TonB-dependent receptor [Desulfuromonadaceae bacterium]